MLCNDSKRCLDDSLRCDFWVSRNCQSESYPRDNSDTSRWPPGDCYSISNYLSSTFLFCIMPYKFLVNCNIWLPCKKYLVFFLCRNCYNHHGEASSSPTPSRNWLHGTLCYFSSRGFFSSLFLVFLATWLSYMATWAIAQSSLHEGMWSLHPLLSDVHPLLHL